MGPPGFEPESMAPKATRINQATLRAQKLAGYLGVVLAFSDVYLMHQLDQKNRLN